jgi:hypothetical protein
MFPCRTGRARAPRRPPRRRTRGRAAREPPSRRFPPRRDRTKPEGMNGQNDHDRSHRPDDEADAREARAILQRVQRETEPQVGVLAERLTRDGAGHFLGRDADPADRVEVWGTRIGRGLGLVGFVVMAVWLVQSLTAGG